MLNVTNLVKFDPLAKHWTLGNGHLLLREHSLNMGRVGGYEDVVFLPGTKSATPYFLR